jgi:hypothetical protein
VRSQRATSIVIGNKRSPDEASLAVNPGFRVAQSGLRLLRRGCRRQRNGLDLGQIELPGSAIEIDNQALGISRASVPGTLASSI